jgi:hypothetical protein
MLIEKIITEARTSFKKLNYDQQYNMVKNYVLNETDFKRAKRNRFITTCLEDSGKETPENIRAYGRFYTWYYTRHCIPKASIVTHLAGSVPDKTYDELITAPIRMVNEGFEKCDPEEVPDLWSAYVSSREGCCWWIADCRTEDDVTRFTNVLSILLRLMLHLPIEKQWSTHPFTTDVLVNALAVFAYIENKRESNPLSDDPELIQCYLSNLDLLPKKQAA